MADQLRGMKRAPRRRFSRAVSTVIDKSKILGVRAGLRSPHRFTGIWIVVVDGRVFARSWTRRPDGWFAAFLDDPFSVIEVGSRRIRIRAVPARGMRESEKWKVESEKWKVESPLRPCVFAVRHGNL